MTSELIELRDEVGWADQSDQKLFNEVVARALMECLNEIHCLRYQLNHLAETTKEGQLILAETGK